jgi:hypothetical protein
MTTLRAIPIDAVLPQLGYALDTQYMQRIFEQQLGAWHGDNKIRVLGCDIERVKYRPKRNCIIGYKLRIEDNEGEHEQRLCVGIYTPGEAHARYEKAMLEANIAVPNFAPAFLIASLNMVAWAFPNERKLSALPLMMDAEQLREKILPEIVQKRWGCDWKIFNIINNISNYFPEHTCCVSVTLTLQHAASGALRNWEVIGKTRYDDAGAETFKQMQTLWQQNDSAATYARPLAYQSEYRLLWQERVPGETLHAQFAAGLVDSALFIRVARAVAALHSSRVTTLRKVTLGDLINNLTASQEVISTARPNCAFALEQIIGSLLSGSERLDWRFSGTWHGDLHSRNILVNAEHIYFIDLDRVSVGPPLAELGSLLAELIYRACLEGKPVEALQPILTPVVDTYRQHVMWPVNNKDVAWFTAAALIHERALRCVRSIKCGPADMVDQLIASATIIAEGHLFDATFNDGTSISNAEQAA